MSYTNKKSQDDAMFDRLYKLFTSQAANLTDNLSEGIEDYVFNGDEEAFEKAVSECANPLSLAALAAKIVSMRKAETEKITLLLRSMDVTMQNAKNYIRTSLNHVETAKSMIDLIIDGLNK